MKTLEQIARQYSQAFERSEAGHYTWNRKHQHGEEIRDLAFEAHEGHLPDDWIWDTLAEAFDAVEDGMTQDDLPERADGSVEVYYGKLKTWFSDCAIADEAISEAKSDGLVSDEADIYERIQAGQYQAISQIYGLVLQFCQDHIDEDEDEDESDQP